MNFPEKDLQIALHEYQEWGEKLRMPRDARIAKLLRQRSAEEISEIIALCKAVEDFSWEIATSVRDNRLSKEEALDRIKNRFPFMSTVNVSRTYSQAMYYTLK